MRLIYLPQAPEHMASNKSILTGLGEFSFRLLLIYFSSCYNSFSYKKSGLLLWFLFFLY